MTTHKCPIDGCNVQLPQHILMCRPHWARVPSGLKRQIYATWNNGNPVPAYLKVRAEAVQAVNERINPTNPQHQAN